MTQNENKLFFQTIKHDENCLIKLFSVCRSVSSVSINYAQFLAFLLSLNLIHYISIYTNQTANIFINAFACHFIIINIGRTQFTIYYKLRQAHEIVHLCKKDLFSSNWCICVFFFLHCDRSHSSVFQDNTISLLCSLHGIKRTTLTKVIIVIRINLN